MGTRPSYPLNTFSMWGEDEDDNFAVVTWESEL